MAGDLEDDAGGPGGRGHAERDQVRFASLFEAHYGAVLAYLLRRCEAGTAEEMASDTFVVAWRRREVVPEHALPWLLTVARNLLANQRRSSARERAWLAEEGPRAVTAAAPDGAELAVERSAALTAFGRLNEDDRELLRLIAWEGLGPDEAAEVLGCSMVALKVRLHRARRRLDRALVQESARNDGAGRPARRPAGAPLPSATGPTRSRK